MLLLAGVVVLYICSDVEPSEDFLIFLEKTKRSSKQFLRNLSLLGWSKIYPVEPSGSLGL